jgi:hypothetical protein
LNTFLLNLTIALGNLFNTIPLANEYDKPKHALAPNVAQRQTKINPGIAPNSYPDKMLRKTGPGIAKLYIKI